MLVGNGTKANLIEEFKTQVVTGAFSRGMVRTSKSSEYIPLSAVVQDQGRREAKRQYSQRTSNSVTTCEGARAIRRSATCVTRQKKPA